MSTTHLLPPPQTEDERQSVSDAAPGFMQVVRFWFSIAVTGFTIGMMLILFVRLQGLQGDSASPNDRIVQSLAIAFSCTVMLASLAWNHFSLKEVSKSHRLAAGFGALICFGIGLMLSIETMRRPMDLVVTSDSAGDRIVPPSVTAP